MEIPAEALAAVKQYMRVEDDTDDAIIAACYGSAMLYLQNAGVTQPDLEPELFNLAVWSLTLYYYDRRDATGSDGEMPAGLRGIINQLKLTRTGWPEE